MKVVVLKKRTLIIAAAAVCAAVAVIIIGLCGAAPTVKAIVGNKQTPIYRVARADKEISLSFDAAWGNEDTQTLIDILKKYHINATFFVVGGWVDKYPESVKALADAGNEVMNHSSTHPHMSSLSRQQMLDEINACDDKIEKVTGKRPVLFRPPYGDYNNALIEVLKSVDHYAIQWDVDSLDWKGITADKIEQRVLPQVKSGSIILFHNAALHTPEALPTIIENLQKQGYRIVPISQLIYKNNYSIDRAGEQHPDTAASPAPSASGRVTSHTN